MIEKKEKIKLKKITIKTGERERRRSKTDRKGEGKRINEGRIWGWG